MLQNLLSRSRQLRKDEGGFTLIELLIVILILGVLAGIVVFSVRGINDKGVSAACKTSKATIATAFESKVAQTASGALPDAATTTVVSLYPDYIHNDPTGSKVGGVTVGAATTVADVDGAAC